MFLFLPLSLVSLTSLFAPVLCDLCIYIMRLMLVFVLRFLLSSLIVVVNIGREIDFVLHLVVSMMFH
jgi:hypothetical protein